MSTVTTAELVARLAVAALAIGGPTLLYLGLWRFLAWLRDDALVDRLAARGAIEEPRPAAVDVLASATAGVDGRRCPGCGSPIIAGATRCQRCRRALDREPDPGDGSVGTASEPPARRRD
ncbi:hypothetical protein [Halorubrum lipolyticum]|uniref:Zinc ribbon domain-containing protein n=1 Tax=Halorubrum lipolyticum DSM 21995 TaxID=1227482 RepID=M0NK54_9EURY|nr:hypothetical protein [Halorubrum lipolyticum]EMA57035.1 hypothetical protein C469_14913 [Halorubrum lipolyticum DSM 21995]